MASAAELPRIYADYRDIEGISVNSLISGTIFWAAGTPLECLKTLQGRSILNIGSNWSYISES